MEREGTAEVAEFSAGLQTRQEEKYVISLFLLLLRGKFYKFFMTVALAVPPLTVKNRHVRLIGRIRYIKTTEVIKRCLSDFHELI